MSPPIVGVAVFFNCLLLHFCYAQSSLIHPANNLFNIFAPGELLKLLERSATAQNLPRIAQRRADSKYIHNKPSAADIRNTTIKSLHKRTASEDFLNPSSASQEYNYDQAYEEFVRQYFSDKIAENSAAPNEASTEPEDSSNSAEQVSLEQDSTASVELEPHTGESKKRNKVTQRKAKLNCRKLRPHKNQTCTICENAKTGEKSKSCSWSRESEPKSYAFGRERSFKKQKDLNDEIPDESISESEEQSASPSLSHHNNSCSKRIIADKACYRCYDSNGWNTQCHAVNKAIPQDQISKKTKKNEHKRKQTQQRIYKRTISYSYEKGGNTSMATTTQSAVPKPTTEVLAENNDSNAPSTREKVFIKVVKQNNSG